MRWVVAVVLAAGAGVTSAGGSFAADDAEIYVVQALPGRAVDVAVDGKTVARGVKTAAVAGPFKVSGGDRRLTIRSGGSDLLERRLNVRARSSWDVVVHLPAEADAEPAMTVYQNDLSAVPKDKASLTVAHTAAVPPADIRVNGKVRFENIANGESLNLVVPVATYQVAIVPTGKSKPVLLGPVSLTVKGGALNRVYAVGDPREKTMNVALHIITMSSTGSPRPSKVNTGTGGQAVGAGPRVVVDLLQ